jgi:hypothetical protein
VTNTTAGGFGWWPLVGQMQPVQPRHRDVEQHHIAGVAAQPLQRAGPVGGLAGDDAARLGAGLDQRAQARARKQLVVDDHHCQRR